MAKTEKPTRKQLRQDARAARRDLADAQERISALEASLTVKDRDHEEALAEELARGILLDEDLVTERARTAEYRAALRTIKNIRNPKMVPGVERAKTIAANVLG